MLVLAPLNVPTDVLVVPRFSMFRSLGLINSLSGVALVNGALSLSIATVILARFFRS